ncbi:hypothetical protein AYO21_07307 [Fonsecaea monophora]|uniref:Uncharacterized protein n=1 Tax=Fonsecaea monophora TaxID=254056 RepID=A0A177F2G2_9EURO|nr:hypothetical protein AYO21_07307 [Fonsecaea monophora]KAH0828312.1 hypothetical protein FOPE_00253 [Fonsecaea pedrosoi]OAG38485.1 hypothetical protein AYO21_07307 [Fonsecaea monophora]
MGGSKSPYNDYRDYDYDDHYDGFATSSQQPYGTYTPSDHQSARLNLHPNPSLPPPPPPTYTQAIEESSAQSRGKAAEAGYPYSQSLSSPISPSLSISPSRSRLPSPTSPGSSLSRSPSRLPKPIAIPATLGQYGSPFLRAYPPCLAQYHISPTLFLSFLDNLNRVAVKSPPLTALSLAGNLVGMVPLGTAQIVGGAVNLAAEVSAGVIQHGRTEIELRRANTDIFRPRGLKVEIAKTEALAKLVGMEGVFGADGKLNKKARLLLPLEGIAADGGGDVSGQQRRLDAMKPWIAELDITPLPEIDVPANAMSRLNVKINERDRRNGEKKLIEKRNKVQGQYEKEAGKAQRDFDKEMAKINKDLDKHLREIDDKLAEATRKNKSRDVAKLERDRQRALDRYHREKSKEEKDFHKDMKEVEKDRMKDDKEEKNMRNLNWLVIRELNAWSGDGPNVYLPTP